MTIFGVETGEKEDVKGTNTEGLKQFSPRDLLSECSKVDYNSKKNINVFH